MKRSSWRWHAMEPWTAPAREVYRGCVREGVEALRRCCGWEAQAVGTDHVLNVTTGGRV